MLYFVLGAQRTDIIHAEGQHVAVANGIYYGVAVQFVAKSALGGGEIDVAYGASIVGEYWRTCKTEDMVFFELLHNGAVHVAELRAVALVEYHHYMLIVNIV